MKTFTFENFTAVLGRNSKENWQIFDEADEDDMWFHIEKLPSPHLILKTNGEDLTNNIISNCALEVKKYSKYASFKKITIIYSPIKYLSKGSKEGEIICNKRCKSIVI